MKQIIVAIDGYSSTGKSTFAKLIAKEYGYKYIDTGAMYRAVTLYALRNGMIRDGRLDREALLAGLDRITLDFLPGADGSNDMLLNGTDVEKEIRGMEVSQYVSLVSGVGEVRAKLLALQRRMGARKGVVMDGRDIGTTVFPEAELKIFMTADPEVRAVRRYEEFRSKGAGLPLEDVRENLRERDRLDETRAISPLRCAPDALVLDNSRMTLDGQMEWVRGVMAERLNNESL